MNELKQWTLCLIIGAVAGAFAMAITPRGTMSKAVRAVTGVFIVASMCSPLSELLEKDVSINTFADSVYEDDNSDELNGYIMETFKNEIEKQILSVADRYNADVTEIYINADINTDGCIIIHKISVAVKSVANDGTSELSKKLSEEIGINISVNAE